MVPKPKTDLGHSAAGIVAHAEQRGGLGSGGGRLLGAEQRLQRGEELCEMRRHGGRTVLGQNTQAEGRVLAHLWLFVVDRLERCLGDDWRELGGFALCKK